jgi:hypothetical protein
MVHPVPRYGLATRIELSDETDDYERPNHRLYFTNLERMGRRLLRAILDTIRDLYEHVPIEREGMQLRVAMEFVCHGRSDFVCPFYVKNVDINGAMILQTLKDVLSRNRGRAHVGRQMDHFDWLTMAFNKHCIWLFYGVSRTSWTVDQLLCLKKLVVSN